ncbi:MAG: hypothetical protein NC084_11985 [Bacteroides sp.]|nr:hypothetical protein [Eubacterium sp.]MCM1419300.1 hypothetical protein [Roseburia sp.]MCM1463412.1 hypothetical protein [Bacteroides sp.]
MIDVSAVKNELNITYETDLAIEQRLSGILRRSEAIIREYAGIGEDEPFDDADEELILNLCRYIWNGAYEDFARNFASELLLLRAKYAVKEVGENGDEEAGEIP